MDTGFELDAEAKLVVEVALGTAGAFGDVECGTAYLLYGVVATAQGEVAELIELFALTPLRVERAITSIRSEQFSTGAQYDGDPTLSPAATMALRTQRKSGEGPTGVFEVLLGILTDQGSSANSVLRYLGVRTEEFLRLVTYGTWHLSSQEADELLSSLDRRIDDPYLPWWGPTPEEMADGSFDELLDGPRELASSRSARATLTSVRRIAGGLSITVAMQSIEAWVLAPEFEPREILVPGSPVCHRIGPDHFRLSVVAFDLEVSNEVVHDRWSQVRPVCPVLIPISHDIKTTRPNDRRASTSSMVETTWWMYGAPTSGVVEVRADWPAEVVHGAAVVDLDSALAY